MSAMPATGSADGWSTWRPWQERLDLRVREISDGAAFAAACAATQAMNPGDLSKLLTAAGIRHALIGAHAVSMRTRAPRNTSDVDFVVDDPAAAAAAICAAHPGLVPASLGPTIGVTLLRDGEPALGLLLARHCGRHLVFSETTMACDVPVASVEMLIALKYLAIRSVDGQGMAARPLRKRSSDYSDILALIEAHPGFAERRVWELLARAANADVAQRWSGDLARIRADKALNLDIDG
ncbi:hypothetical protein LBMAG53_36830 [Planctomycetota bacterium]|nr:hypothetical protein LBMAG53_36830 [Planctomycetota bacterium]